MMSKRVQKVHMVGIGGAGMSGIAELLHNLGFSVTGSDLEPKDTTRYLESLGIRVYYGHQPEHVEGAEVVVVSTAVPPDNPEVVRARELKIPVIPRAEMLAELMRMKFSIAVSGAHGKSTTTSMIAAVLDHAGLDPTVVVGGRIRGFGSGARLGAGDYLVAEADESDGSFLKLYPTVAVITNIDREHLDTYGSFEALKQAFVDFANRVPFYGAAILNLDDPPSIEILPRIERRVITFGLSRQADVSARRVELKGLGSRARVYYKGVPLTDLTLRVPGQHNLLNALAAFAVGLDLDVLPTVIAEALEGFQGVMRRFEIKGEVDGVTVVDDYGHHPTEIAAVLKAARTYWEGRIVVLFQPHRYTRTALLHKDFGPVFHEADVVVVTRLYPAGEKPIEGVSEALIYQAIREAGHQEVYLEPEDPLKRLRQILRPGDLLLTLGAGDVYKYGLKLLEEGIKG